MTEPSITEFIPALLMLVLAVGFVGLTMVVTHWLGPHRKTKVKLEAFECGIESKGNARAPFHIKYFLVVEVIFMYPWAVNFQDFGVPGFVEMLLFVALLLIGFFYIIKKKALEWED
jgi:NADH-quinone oxidoreductase subunit A